MVYKKTYWKDVYKALRERILNGDYKPGSDFPTNKEIGEEFDLHNVSVQTAVSQLIREGLVIQAKRKGVRRTVRIKPRRSKRNAGFSKDHGQKATKKILDLKLIKDANVIPDNLAAPVLYYHNEQYVDGLLVTISRSYIPDDVPLTELHQLLDQDPPASLYTSFEVLGHKTTAGEEAIIIDFATDDEKEELHLPSNSTVPIARITRKVYDQDGKLIELCKLLSRGDCYEFDYKFDF